MNIGLLLGILAGVMVTTIENEKIKKKYKKSPKIEKFNTDLEIENKVEIKKVEKNDIKKK